MTVMVMMMMVMVMMVIVLMSGIFPFCPQTPPRHSAHAMQSQLLQHEMDIGFYPQCKQLVTIKL